MQTLIVILLVINALCLLGIGQKLCEIKAALVEEDFSEDEHNNHIVTR